MLDDFRKSLSAALYERTSSPLYGTFIFSWCLWNWKILYILFWVDKTVKFIDKIDYINSNAASINNLIWFPILSTIGFLVVGNFLGNGAYWWQLQFDRWRTKQKEKIDSDKRLTIEESILLRSEMNQLGESFQRTLDRKDSEIVILKKQFEELNRQQKLPEILENLSNSEKPLIAEAVLVNDPNLRRLFDASRKVPEFDMYLSRLRNLLRKGAAISVQEKLTSDISATTFIPTVVIDILETYDALRFENGRFKFTDFGKKFILFHSQQLDLPKDK